jgi:His-Xaa-Ser system radical SAM maturase HxsC
MIVEGLGVGLAQPIVGRVRREGRTGPSTPDEILVTTAPLDTVDAGYAAYVSTSPVRPAGGEAVVGVSSVDDLADGHLVALVAHPSGRAFVRTLYRPESSHNFLFVTDRCNSFCLMCSQPPKDRDDTAFHGTLNGEVVRLLEEGPPMIGITGGEPTLAGEDLLRVLRTLHQRFPDTNIHMLSNGRGFAWRAMARSYAEACGPALTVAVPIYSDDPLQHDHIVQARGAFDQTVRGILNLARWGIDVEIRVVIHALSLPRLPETAEMIARTFPFASHVALMGLEPTGFAKTNWNTLWVDPGDAYYQQQLTRAATLLRLHGMNTSIYNHQLCVLPRNLWPIAANSISDWKNIYVEECEGCAVRDQCGGFFASAEAGRRSRRIVAAKAPSPRASLS